MRYGSVCSGIEAATSAWHPLGWQPAFFSEIEPFPSAVLAHRYPTVPNLGDMTQFKTWPNYAIDLLVGGTPCQSFSVAGLRKGLDDPRGNLMLTYLAIADRYRPKWLVWENVPGVLSSNGGRDFGALLGGMGQLGYGFAYRVLDAQFVRVESHPRAVPQRRRRVFVVGHLGDWRRAAAVLFERESLRGDSAPSREAGKGVAGTIAARTKGGGGLGTDFDLAGGVIQTSARDVDASLTSNYAKQPDNSDTALGPNLVAHALRADGFDASEDGTGRATPIVPVACFDERQVTSKTNRGQCEGEVAGTQHSTPLTIAFSCKDHGADASKDVAPTMRAMAETDGNANAGGQLAIAIQERAVCENPSAGPDGAGIRTDGAAYTLEARSVPQAVAFDCEQGGDTQNGYSENHSPPLRGKSGRTCVAHSMAVRRLTPCECERLQGFPDDWTLIPFRGKPAADGPRYRALGNSMACNVMRWIGERIQQSCNL